MTPFHPLYCRKRKQVGVRFLFFFYIKWNEKNKTKQRRCMYVYVLFYTCSCFFLYYNLLENMNYIHITWLGIYYITSINFFLNLINQYWTKSKPNAAHIFFKIKCNARISAPQKTNTKTKKFVFDILFVLSFYFLLFVFFFVFFLNSLYIVCIRHCCCRDIYS